MAIADMERGMGGRIEAAFEAAKAKGEAAFITFITAGYPTRAGTLCSFSLLGGRFGSFPKIWIVLMLRDKNHNVNGT